MDPFTLGGLISAGGSLLGGLFGSSSASKDRAAQMDLAKHGISYRVADAKASGIHPLAALGASQANYTPVGDGGLGDSVGRAGEAVSRALDPLNKAQLDVLRSEAERNRAEAANQVAAARSRTMIQAQRNVAIGGTGINDMRPPARPTVELSWPGSSRKFVIPSDVARQYHLKPGDSVSHDLIEQLIGDLASELLAPALTSAYGDFSRRWGGEGILLDAHDPKTFVREPGAYDGRTFDPAP